MWQLAIQALAFVHKSESLKDTQEIEQYFIRKLLKYSKIYKKTSMLSAFIYSPISSEIKIKD
jgi:hypothetical protein